METSLPGPVISVDWLAQNIENANLIILEVVLAKDEESALKIPKSLVFNIDLLSDPDSNLPHMMPGLIK